MVARVVDGGARRGGQRRRRCRRAGHEHGGQLRQPLRPSPPQVEDERVPLRRLGGGGAADPLAALAALAAEHAVQKVAGEAAHLPRGRAAA
eukprot:scaffold86197_cov67-Phaeocystis_antarctica.AAC.7